MHWSGFTVHKPGVYCAQAGGVTVHRPGGLLSTGQEVYCAQAGGFTERAGTVGSKADGTDLKRSEGVTGDLIWIVGF